MVCDVILSQDDPCMMSQFVIFIHTEGPIMDDFQKRTKDKSAKYRHLLTGAQFFVKTSQYQIFFFLLNHLLVLFIRRQVPLIDDFQRRSNYQDKLRMSSQLIWQQYVLSTQMSLILISVMTSGIFKHVCYRISNASRNYTRCVLEIDVFYLTGDSNLAFHPSHAHSNSTSTNIEVSL